MYGDRAVRDAWIIGDGKIAATRTVASYGTLPANSTLTSNAFKLTHPAFFSLLVFCGMDAGTPNYTLEASQLVASKSGEGDLQLIDPEWGSYSNGFPALVTAHTSANQLWATHGIALPVAGIWRIRMTNLDAVNAATAALATNKGIRMAVQMYG